MAEPGLSIGRCGLELAKLEVVVNAPLLLSCVCVVRLERENHGVARAVAVNATQEVLRMQQHAELDALACESEYNRALFRRS